MDHFEYKNNQLYAENVAITEIAKHVGTPFYCYSSATLKRHYEVFKGLFDGLNVKVCYAVKANSNIAVLSVLAGMGAGADVVSEGEIRRALAAKVDPSNIVFSGVGKTRDEMAFALNREIFQFNIESEPELYQLSEVASAMHVTAKVAFRVNPSIEGGYTHGKITTGTKESKFGIDIPTARKLYKKASELDGIEVQGISIHIGSQLTNYEPFKEAFQKLAILVGELEEAGIKIKTVDLGGGIGINYGKGQSPDLESYAKIVKETFGNKPYQLIFEPGRVIVGNAGILVSSVIYVKQTEGRNFVIVDAAMNDLIRPSMYSAYHEIVPVILSDERVIAADVVGPVCETGDIFAELRELPSPEPDALIAFRSAGAYGAVMSSTYNSRLLIPEVMVDGDKWAVIRRRPTFEEMLEQDIIPSWL